MAYFNPAVWDAAGRESAQERVDRAALRAAKRAAELDQDVRSGVESLMQARFAGDRRALLGTVSQFEEDCLDLHAGFDPAYGPLDSSLLCGPWARLRDELAAGGIRVGLHHFVRGRGCNGRHWAWNIVAEW